MSKESIGQTLRNLREKNKYNSKEVAEMLNDRFSISVNHKSIYNYETGRNFPDVDIFLALCSIYNCDDILYEFGYTNIRESWKVDSNEDADILDKYHGLSEDGQNMIRGALGLEKNTTDKLTSSTASKNIANETSNVKDA
jgi:transcriptional regulator with XRE-family HTH domain